MENISAATNRLGTLNSEALTRLDALSVLGVAEVAPKCLLRALAKKK